MKQGTWCIVAIMAFLLYAGAESLNAQCKITANVRYQNVSSEKWYVSFHKDCSSEVRLTWYVVYSDGSRSDKSSTVFYASSTDMEYPWGYNKAIADVVLVNTEWTDDGQENSGSSGNSFGDALGEAFASGLSIAGGDAYAALAVGCGNTTMGFPGAKLLLRLGQNVCSYGISASVGYNPALKKHGGSGFGWSAGGLLYFWDGFISVDWTQSSFYPKNSGNMYDKDYIQGLSISIGYNLFLWEGLGLTADVGYKIRPGASTGFVVWNAGIFWAFKW